MSSTDFLTTLTSEELLDVQAYVEFRRSVLMKGYRPVIGATKGKKTKLLKTDDSSIAEFVDEVIESDIFAATSVPDLKAKAKLRGFKLRQSMLNYQGAAWKSDLVAEFLNISVQMVSRKRREDKLLGVSYGNKEYLYPCWQFTDSGVLSGLEVIITTLDSGLVPDWDKLRFFTAGNERLDDLTPVEALQESRLEEVKRLAEGYGKQISQ
jgi:hypothetical protein